MIPTTAIYPYTKNPRVNKNAVDKTATSIKEFGFRQPIVVDENMIIIAGHTRLLAAQKLNLTHVPVYIVTDMTPDKIKAYRVADNRVAQESSWDNTLLSGELQDLRGMNFDLTFTGFDLPEISHLLGEIEFKADTIDNQGKLDEKKRITCPACKHEFSA